MNLYGENSILERLKTNAKSIKAIFIEQGKVTSKIEDITRQRRIPVRYLAKREFQKKEKGLRSQGLIADIDDFEYTELEDILSRPVKVLPVLLFLDNLNDPQNLGGIIRSAACLGGFAVVLPRYDSVEVTEATLRVACGGENYVPICKVVNLSLAIKMAKEAGYWVAGAVIVGGEDLTQVKLNFPLGLVIGSEARGIRQGLVRHLDFKFTIPMANAGLSFNVACATSLFCYEVTRQRIGR